MSFIMEYFSSHFLYIANSSGETVELHAKVYTSFWSYQITKLIMEKCLAISISQYYGFVLSFLNPQVPVRNNLA